MANLFFKKLNLLGQTFGDGPTYGGSLIDGCAPSEFVDNDQ